jgi:hypothetical protein
MASQVRKGLLERLGLLESKAIKGHLGLKVQAVKMAATANPDRLGRKDHKALKAHKARTELLALTVRTG